MAAPVLEKYFASVFRKLFINDKVASFCVIIVREVIIFYMRSVFQ